VHHLASSLVLASGERTFTQFGAGDSKVTTLLKNRCANCVYAGELPKCSSHVYFRTASKVAVNYCFRRMCDQPVYTDGLYAKGTRAHTHRERIREWLWELRGTPLNISRCLGGSRRRELMAALRAGPPPRASLWPLCSADGSTHTQSNKLYRKVKHRYRPNLSPRQRLTAKARHDQAALAASAEARGATQRARPRSPTLTQRDRWKETDVKVCFTHSPIGLVQHTTASLVLACPPGRLLWLQSSHISRSVSWYLQSAARSTFS